MKNQICMNNQVHIAPDGTKFYNLTGMKINMRIDRKPDVIFLTHNIQTFIRILSDNVPCGIMASIETSSIDSMLGDFPLVNITVGNIINLPKPEENTFYIVPKEVAMECRDRKDILYPYDQTGFIFGNIMFCSRLARIS